MREWLLGDPMLQWDLYQIRLDEIIDFIHEIGQRLNLDTNPYWREAFEVSCLTTNLSRPVVEAAYRTCFSNSGSRSDARAS